MIENYDYIKVSGLSEITIPIVKRSGELSEKDGSSRTPDWVVSIDTGDGGTKSTLHNNGAFFPKDTEQEDVLKYFGSGTTLENHTELFGWYCKLSNFVKEDCVNNFYKSGTLWHSDVFLVVQNGYQNAYVNYCLAEGVITNEISISRLLKINNFFIPSQTLIFKICQWSGIYSYLEYSILRFTACTRQNICLCIDQFGSILGKCANFVDYSFNSNSFII